MIKQLAAKLAAVCAIIVPAAITQSAHADIISLQQGTNNYFGTEDTTIFQDFPDNSSGGFPYIFAGVNKSSAPRRTLIKFDLQGYVPTGSTVTSATLWLFTEFGRPAHVDCSLHRISREWTEGNNPMLDIGTVGQGAPAQTGDPTWKTAAYGDVTAAWHTLGGDYTATASGTGQVLLSGVWFSITGQGMADDIESWVNVGDNFGWILRASEEGFQNAKRFYSSEWPKTGADNDKQPKLIIEFTPPSAISDWTLY